MTGTNANRKLGNGFERDLCGVLAYHGFWAHNLAQNSAGQPFDVIAARGGYVYPIDCKLCTQNYFMMGRVEENQYNAMLKWDATGNGESYFALKMADNDIYMLPFSAVRELSETKKSLKAAEIRTYAIPFDTWVLEA